MFQTAVGCERLLSACGLEDMDAVFRWQQGERLDKPGLEPWRQRWRISLGQETSTAEVVYLKRFLNPPLRRQCARWLQGNWHLSTAGIEWQNARDLAAAGIPAAEAVAFGQEMIGPWEKRSFVMLRAVEGISLEKWVPMNLPGTRGGADVGDRRERIDRLARFVAGFHRAGFVHRDLYLSHVFLQPRIRKPGETEREDYRLIDLQRVFRPRWRRCRWVVKDLAALHYSAPVHCVTTTERLRFLVRYVRCCSQFGSARRLAAKVHARTLSMLGRRRRAGAAESGGSG
ncbi:MAG: lipopolysaccharide kinase InaA family protein [Phycisphaerae bacterium]